MDSFSYSTIQAAYKCHKYYKLLYVDKLQSPEPPSGDLLFGSAMHAGIQAYLEGSDGVQTFNTFWDSEKEKENAYGRNDWEQLKTQGGILLTRFERLHLKKFNPYKTEERIYSTLGPELGNGAAISSGGVDRLHIEGTPDCVGEFNGAPSIIDFKTSGYRYTNERLLVNEQMPLYAYMAGREWGYEAVQYVYLVMIKGNDPSIQTLTMERDKKRDQATLDNIYKVCKEIDALTEYTENRASCIMGAFKCPFFSTCHGGK